ncbi:MAG: oxygen-independent coproporphyrinogen III oxidase [Burkholderiales bacterium]|jgi:oxygen-independent coproporphyrinogen-3 oxidase|nr:oxygen-independent coproporphyrinogen III oxidase [Burkholderiales bacterium]
MSTTPFSKQVAFDEALIRKYDEAGPRYTSYPTADRFHNRFTEVDYQKALAARREMSPPEPLSVYLHLPFCSTICYYCACNKIITKDHGRSAKYIRYLARELDLATRLIEGRESRALKQLHWGGGTPTFLSQEEMRDLMGHLRKHFTFTPDAEVSIEVDPRKVDEATVVLLGELGFNRISVGVQDFNADVQKAINRIQSEEETLAVIHAARAHGFVSVNIDLIYGLPKQTLAGFAETLDRVIAVSPDRIALYNYAHVPHMAKPQRRIALEDVPKPEDKLRILALAIEKLGDAGYVYIGMDHFAKPDDELARAQREGTLHRNFQGYTTHADCDLLAFGISGIGKVGSTYVQSVKTLDDYYAMLDAQKLPVLRGYTLTRDDELRRAVIQQLMCQFELVPTKVEAQWGIKFDDCFATERAALRPLAEDGLIEVLSDRIKVTDRGRLLVRTVAMAFDRHLREAETQGKYSKVI